MPGGYRGDLARVHDAGFTSFAERAAPAILRELARRGLRGGLVVELGCGTGALTARLLARGHRVLGVDLSPAMLALARRRAPGAVFRRGSFLEGSLPPCDAVVAVGEVLNYRMDVRNDAARRRAFFRRAFAALRPGGVLIFDFLAPLGRGSRSGSAATTGPHWAVLVTRTEDPGRGRLRRRITTFLRRGRSYRRAEETHDIILLDPPRLAADLRSAGFRVALRRGYGAARLGPGHHVALAARPRP